MPDLFQLDYEAHRRAGAAHCVRQLDAVHFLIVLEADFKWRLTLGTLGLDIGPDEQMRLSVEVQLLGASLGRRRLQHVHLAVSYLGLLLNLKFGSHLLGALA